MLPPFRLLFLSIRPERIINYSFNGVWRSFWQLYFFLLDFLEYFSTIDYLSALNHSIEVPHLIKIAIAHYQFETIHPFLDGNGRLGRLLITLYLVAVGLLDRPTLYLSDFFEKNKALYYDNLTFVRTSDKLAQWIKFFLVAVIETSDKGIHVFREILRLRDEIEGEKLLSLGTRIQNGKILISHLYKKPIINVKEVEEILGLTTKPANRIVQDFVDLGILKEVTGYKRNRLFLFEEYYKLFADG